MTVSQMRKISIIILAVVLLGPGAALAGPKPNAVRIFAHRGFHLHAPENSLAALQAAIDLGISGSEVDLRTTFDGRLVLFHDASLARTTNGHGEVARQGLAQLKKLHLKAVPNRSSTERIPTLAEALKLIKKHPRFTLILDLKNADPAQAAGMVLKHQAANQVVFFVANPQNVSQVRAIQKVDPNIKISVDIQNWWKTEGLAGFAVKALGVQALFASEWFFPRCGFREAREAGAEVMVFLWGEKDLKNKLKRAIGLGAQAVSSDRPDVLIKALRKPRFLK